MTHDELRRLAVSALEPFAKLADEIEACCRVAADDPTLPPGAGNPENWFKSCKWPDLMKAREALDAIRARKKPT